MFNQQRNIFRPLAQRRDVQTQHIDPVVKVFAKPPGFNHLHQVLVRCRQQAQVDRDDPFAADPHDFLFLNHPQDSRLQRQRHFTDFIHEQGSAVGQFHQTDFAATPGAGERPFLIAEQFAFQQIFRYGGAVEGNKRAFGAPAQIVQPLGDHLLAGSRLAGNQHI